MNRHYDKQQVEAAATALIEASRQRAAAHQDTPAVARIFQAVAPALVRVQFDEANRGTLSPDAVDGYVGVFGWWLAQIVRHGCSDPHTRIEIVEELAAQITAAALKRLEGGTLVATVEGQSGGHA